MAAYRRVYDSRHLQADCQEPGSAPNPTLGNRVWVTFSSWWGEIWSGPSWVVVYPHGYMPRRLFHGGSVHCSVHSVRTWCRSVKGGGVHCTASSTAQTAVVGGRLLSGGC